MVLFQCFQIGLYIKGTKFLILAQIQGMMGVPLFGNGTSWYCAGAITKKGHPHHPLYLRKDEKIKPFDVKGYLEKLV